MDKKIVIIILIISLVVTSIFYFLSLKEDCKITSAILINQSIGGDCCEDCLIMDIQEWTFCGYSCGIDIKNQTYFFENEKNYRYDIENGDAIKIKKCFIDKVNDWRVRGIWKESA